MSGSIPAWADEALSRDLPTIRERGEDGKNEFKAAFPTQAHRLGSSIAAMATSGGGYIFIGVRDNGDLIGIDASTAERRDDLILRAQGITDTVDPTPIAVEFAFAIENDTTVLVIQLGRQDEPVYYYDSRPYVRDGRRRRPARPEEVQKLVWTHPSSEHQRNLERLQFESLERMSRQSAEQREVASKQAAEVRQRAIDGFR